MTTLTVNGHKVTVDDGFLKLSREEQDATVDEIAKSLSLQLKKILVGVTVDPAAVAEARRYSYSDDEIVDHLSHKAPEQFKKAKEAGYGSKEILDYFGRENAQSPGVTKVGTQSAPVAEITTADKINATLRVFTQPQFYFEMIFIVIVLAALARAKRTARSVPTKVGRLGVVLHWASLIIAAVLLGAAGLILTQMKHGDDFILVVSGVLGVSAVIVWLIGKSPTVRPNWPR
jgi:hypothetical protein